MHGCTRARATRQLGHKHVLVVAVGDRDLEVSAEELAWWVGCLSVCGTGGLCLQCGAVSQKLCQYKQQRACCAGPTGASARPRGSHHPSEEVISLNLAVNPNVLAATPRGCRGGGLGWDSFNDPQARRPHPNTQLCKGRSESKPHSQAFHKHTLIIFIKNFNTERAACQEMHLHCQLQSEIALRRCSIPETPSPPPSLSFLLLPFLPFVGPWCW